MKYKKLKQLVVSIVVATSMLTTTVASAAATSVDNSNLTTQVDEENDKGVLKVTLDENGNYSYTEPVGAAVSDENKLFSWSNATVYFVLTDRFENGDTSNDHSYGRSLDANGKPVDGYKDASGTFHGGDLKGLTKKINDGYFTELGINAIWFTAAYEQIHGYTSGNLKADDKNNPAGEDGSGFSHYAYHGYYALDFSALDKNMGTRDESVEVSSGKADDMKDFVTAAHTKGIRVIMDVVMNHVGYATLKDVADLGFGEANGNWKDYYYGQESNRKGGGWEQTNCYNYNSDKWSSWWGKDWVRTERPIKGGDYTQGYIQVVDKPTAEQIREGELKGCQGGLPDILSESTKDVTVPIFLQNKWKKEGRLDTEMASLDKFFKESKLKKTPINYIVKWLSDWVADYGIDGFRCDTAKHIEVEHWAVLKEQSQKALEKWRTNNPDAPGAKWTDKFWMTGECYGMGVDLGADYYDNGFDSMINFTFPADGMAGKLIETTYKTNSAVNFKGSTKSTLSYISSHDTLLGGRKDLYKAGTSLLLSPGGVQIFYGDETARTVHSAPWGWKEFLTRSDMNWNSIDKGVQAHWQKLSKFRSNHLSVGGGSHSKISTDSDNFYAFKREYNDGTNKDTVVCVTGASGSVTLDVSAAFTEGTELRDAYTGKTAKEGLDGKVTFTADKNGVILIEKAVATPSNPINPIPVPTTTVKTALKSGNITTDPDGSQEIGQDVEITTAAATGGDGGYTYKILADGKVIQDFKTNKSATWTPDEEGECTIKVISKDKSGNTATKSLDYNVLPKSEGGQVTESIKIKSFESDVENAKVSDTVNLTASATGDTNIKYSFEVTGKSTESLSSNKGTGTAKWIPKEAGEYTLKVTAIGDSNKSVSKTITINILNAETPAGPVEPANPDKELSASLSIDQNVAHKANTKIRLTAGATGGTSEYVYDFKVNGKSIKKGSSSYFDWTPTQAGTYKLTVNVIDAKGQEFETTDSKIEIAAASQNGPEIPQIDDPANPAPKPGTASDVATKSDYNADPSGKTNSGDANSMLPISVMMLLGAIGIVGIRQKKKVEL